MGIFLKVSSWVLGWAVRNRLVAGRNEPNFHGIQSLPKTWDWSARGLGVSPSRRIVAREVFKQPGDRSHHYDHPQHRVDLDRVKAWKYISKPRQASALERGGKESREVISFTTGLYIFAYLASIVASMTMFDAATKFKLRILSPVFVGLLILLVAFGI
jgi:hypothetical protein